VCALCPVIKFVGMLYVLAMPPARESHSEGQQESRPIHMLPLDILHLPLQAALSVSWSVYVEGPCLWREHAYESERWCRDSC
jgi:hypothetical protein